MVTYTLIDGACTAPSSPRAARTSAFTSAARSSTLGDHPIADELRSLGLPKRALMTMWMERMHGRFETPERVGA